MGEGYLLELHYIQSICRYNFLLEISYFSEEMRVRKERFKGTQQVHRKSNTLMDIRFSTDMQSTKDTKHIFKKSDLNLP